MGFKEFFKISGLLWAIVLSVFLVIASYDYFFMSGDILVTFSTFRRTLSFLAPLLGYCNFIALLVLCFFKIGIKIKKCLQNLSAKS